MLDVIIYEEDEVSIKKNKRIINKTLTGVYTTRVFKKCDSELISLIDEGNRKLYIINMETENNYGLKLATRIRKKHFDDIIILTAKCGMYYDLAFNNRLMALDYICKCNDYDKRLFQTISEVNKIVYSGMIFTFKYNRVVYRIPFKDINYIEKETNIKRCIIHTVNGKYYIVNSLDYLLNELRNGFLRTHQSCIINVNNIKMLDCTSGEVIFINNDYTSLLTEKAKREIKKLMLGN
jgi:DNA-binding LytR/AlgR family response regulator